MRWSASIAFFLTTSLLAVASARAQEGTLLPSRPVILPAPADALTAAERRELDGWLKRVHSWQQLDKRWHNQPAHDAFGRVIARTPEPEPPSWLETRCAKFPSTMLTTLEAPLGPACRVLAGLEEDAGAGAIRAAVASDRAAGEKLVKNRFFTRVHLDGLWTSTSTDYRLYGLVGSHISLVDVGRVQFFGPPGVILLSVPDASGGRAIRVGYTWGMSVRLKDLRLLSPTTNVTLFLTVTKVWVTGNSAYDRLTPGGYDIAGFSLAPRKHTQ
jgi:hypothetical protein